MKSIAIVLPALKQVELKEIEIPSLKDDEVLVETDYSCVSLGTERSIFQGVWSEVCPFPLVPGYQGVGIVREKGEKVYDIPVGSGVFLWHGRLEGEIRSFQGCHSKHAVANSLEDVIKVPEEVEPIEAAELLVAQVGFNAADICGVKEGELVVVIGDGMIGQMSAQNCRARGARVILSGHHDKYLTLAEHYSSDISVNTYTVDLTEVVRKENPDGAGVVIDSVGSKENIDLGIELLHRRGRLVLVGRYGQPVPIDIKRAKTKEVSFHTPSGSTKDRVIKTMRLLQEKKIRIKELLDYHCSYKDAPESYQLMAEKRHNFLSMVIHWK